MTADFPDISHHNPTPDFPGLKTAGAPLVVLKATEGAGYTDPTFRSRWAAAKSASLPRTAYHFARPGTDPATCARGLHALATDAELPLVLDWEDQAVPVDWAVNFLRECDRLTARVSIIYMPQRWCATAGALTPWSLWAARYNTRLGPITPFRAAMAWQYTDAGTLGPHHGDLSHLYAQPVTDPPTAGVKPGDSREKVRFLQVLLSILGKYSGPIDGRFGTEVGEAVRRFKHAHNAAGAKPPLSESEERGWMVGPATLKAIGEWVNLVDQLRKID